MKKGKRFVVVLCTILMFVSGCAGNPAPGKNEIAPINLSPEQKDIVELLSSDGQEILLFDYETKESYKSVEFWVELYESGVLRERAAGINAYLDEAKPAKGRLAVLISHNLDTVFTFTVKEETDRLSHSSEPIVLEKDGMMRGFGPIDAPVSIEAGKEIVLYTSIYADNSIADYSDKQRYIGEPELLSGYPYVQIIKCKFE